MQISQSGIDAIKRHEGLRLFAYLDSAGVPTIGYGSTAGVQMGQHITSSEAEFKLRKDLDWVEKAIADQVKVTLTQSQYDALCSLIFNIGGVAFSDSTLLRKLNAGDYHGAAEEFPRWNKARVNGVMEPLAGLTSRRLAEQSLFREEIDTSPPLVHLGPEPVHTAPRPDADNYPQGETMVAPAVAVAGTFLWELAKSAITAFTPLAQEKLTKELSRHTDKPEIAAQVATAIVNTAQTATGIKDPMEAVVEAKKRAEVVQQMEDTALMTLDKLMPVLERLHTWDREAAESEEASRAAAATRLNNQDELLTKSIIVLLAGVIVGLGALAAGLAAMGVDVQTIIGALLMLVGVVGSKFGTRYDFAYGSSRGSAAKDVLNAELSRRRAP